MCSLGPVPLRPSVGRDWSRKRVIKIFTGCGALAGSMFGGYCLIVAKAAARGAEARVDLGSFVVVVVFALVGALGGLLAGAVVRLFVKAERPAAKENKTA